jgi:hydrogenase expression/formation protein HypD
MKHVDEYRDPMRIQPAVDALRRRCSQRWVIMDVCGGQTHGLLRHGLEAALEDVLELVHGPGCPVCVTPADVIAEAVMLASQSDVILASYGDMLRVPGATGSLLEARARGADVRTILSPLDAVAWAGQSPDRQVVLFAVGFETTAPATALAVLQARQRGLTNFRVLAHHVRVEPAMRAVAAAPGCRVQGFLAAGHVCTVTGFGHYQQLLDDIRRPIVVTGFEPWDLVAGLSQCVDLLERGESALVNSYERCARPEGNPAAQRLIAEVFAVADVPWRGFGIIPAGGLVLRDEFADCDARRLAPSRPSLLPTQPERCRSGDILSGVLKPLDCPHFGRDCTPATPLGAPMVSSEGACAAYYQYR